MKLNKDFELCVKLYSHLGKEPKSCLKLANELGTSRNYLHKLTGILNRAGLLKITNGARGGISKPNKIVTALDIYHALGNSSPKLICTKNFYDHIISIIVDLLGQTVLNKGEK